MHNVSLIPMQYRSYEFALGFKYEINLKSGMYQENHNHRVILSFFFFVLLVCTWSGLHTLNNMENFDRKEHSQHRNFSLLKMHFYNLLDNQSQTTDDSKNLMYETLFFFTLNDTLNESQY